MKNFVLISCSDTSRSTFPLHASYMIGTIGAMTINAIQIKRVDIGVNISPNPIGDVNATMIPT